MIYGDIRKFLTPEVLTNDCITRNDNRVNGHFCLLRNRKAIREAYQGLPYWKERMENPKYLGFDEGSEFYGMRNVFAKESFNTPLSPYIPYKNGVFSFPVE